LYLGSSARVETRAYASRAEKGVIAFSDNTREEGIGGVARQKKGTTINGGRISLERRRRKDVQRA